MLVAWRSANDGRIHVPRIIPSGASQLMAATVRAFAELAEARGERPVIVMLPPAPSFRES